MKRIVITGSSGLLGPYVAEHFIEGDTKFWGLTRRNRRTRGNIDRG